MNLDVVIIGLNSAATLEACLASVFASRYPAELLRVFYVDGGSTDASGAIAARFPGVQILTLNQAHPTPGAGRNLGWRAGRAPFVQFLDADTTLHPDWLSQAAAALRGEIVAVTGNRTEREPERSIFNWIADREWNGPAGVADAFGGDVLVRRSALEAAGGYDDVLVGGEDPELSLRLRQRGGQILRLALPMTTHDLAMTQVSQWSRRAFRTGYGYAAVVARHGFRDGNFWAYELGRILVRGGGGLAMAGASALAAPFSPLASLLCALLATGLLLFPRLFSLPKFERQHDLSRAQARRYAWHCALIVVPEYCGAVRYVWGALTNSPLRNRRPGARKPASLLARWAAIVAGLCAFAGCVTPDTGMHNLEHLHPESEPARIATSGEMKTAEVQESADYATAEEIQAYSETVPTAYLIGPGDVLSITVRGRPQMGVVNAVVAPDGKIAMPSLGVCHVGGMTIDDLTATVYAEMARLFEQPDVVVQIHEYHNNKVFVLGRVAHPGLVRFTGHGTLLEALSMAGGMPTVAEEAFLTRAVIFRGQESVIWVDLTELLNNGNMAHNPRLRNNDIVYIPESDDEMVYVMGEVRTPGAVRLKSDLTVLDAIMSTGGPTEDAKLTNVYLVRQINGRGHVQQIDLDYLIEHGDFSRDYLLEDGDIVFVSTRLLEEINYYIRKITPTIFWLPLVNL